MYGLVLEGGGAKGAYHIGALKAVKELKLNISAVAGTSIGAMNGAMFVQDKLDIAYDYWYNISSAQVLDIDDKYLNQLLNLTINQDNLNYFLGKAKEVLQNRGLDNSYLKNILKDNIDEDLLRNSKMEFAIVTLSISDLKPLELFLEDIPAGKVVDYILASAYLPAFKMQRIDGKILVDGGFYDNLPLKTLINKGYKKLIAVRTYGLDEIGKRKTDDAEVIYINPSEELGRMLNFDQKNARRNIKMGYYDTMRYFKNLLGNKYYITNPKNSEYFLKFLVNTDEKSIISLLNKFSISFKDPYRAFFEKLIPKLNNLIDTDKDCSYAEIIVYLLEKLAEEIDINRFKIYSFDELHKKLKVDYNNKKKSSRHKLPNFFQTSSLLPKQFKEDIIIEIAEELFIKN